MNTNCPQCGAPPQAEAVFCHQCGLRLPSGALKVDQPPQPQPTSAPNTLQRPQPQPSAAADHELLGLAGKAALESLFDKGVLDHSTLNRPANQAILERARTYLTAALDEAELEADQSSAINIVKDLATYYEYTQQPAEAERCYRKALDLQTRLQPDSMDTANTIGRLVQLIRNSASDSELQVLLSRQLSIEERHGEVHGIMTGTCFIGGFDVWLAIDVYARQGNIAEAKHLWKRVLDSGPVRIEVRRKYAEFVRRIGDDREADELDRNLKRDAMMEEARREIEMQRLRHEAAVESMIAGEEAYLRSRRRGE